ncbi:MAG TPA: helix-turn-helix domain-containing protein [Casimicrobiaceae bacterium]|nr:helix-turn-helix domain-containing protein [Casimicrobiaceae bacterium]
MTRNARHNDAEIAAALALLESAKTVQQLRQAQSILIPALAGVSIDMTARLLGVGRNHVCVLRRAFRQAGGPTFGDRERRGGRHRELLSEAQERELVARWRSDVSSPGAGTVAGLHALYEEAVGKRVPRSTLYRLLARVGVAPPRAAKAQHYGYELPQQSRVLPEEAVDGD